MLTWIASHNHHLPHHYKGIWLVHDEENASNFGKESTEGTKKEEIKCENDDKQEKPENHDCLSLTFKENHVTAIRDITNRQR
jgi:hypothetical protein